jgi:uncharacterized protein (DUF983 family)
MFYRMKCPTCKNTVEFVDVQLGHSHCCKRCGCEFALNKPSTSVPLLVIGGFAIALGILIAGLFLWRFHDWWVYRK